MTFLLGTAAGLVLLLGCGWSSYILSDRLLGRHAPTSVRWTGAGLIAYWLLAIVFLILAPLQLFRLDMALVVCGGATIALHLMLGAPRGVSKQLSQELEQTLRALWGLRKNPVFWLLICGLVLVGLRLLRGMVSPPLAWDSLMYHLVKAGTWVQAAGYDPQPAPDAWGYLDYYPQLGEVYWSWAMLPVSGDAYLALAGFLVWLSIVLAAFAGVRSFGGSFQIALLIALTFGFVPAVVKYMTSAYVDNIELAAVLMALLFLRRAFTEEIGGNAVLAAAALGIAAGVKFSGVAVALPGFAILGFVVLWKVRPLGRLVLIMGACTLASSVAVPGYLRAWIERGAPTFPYPVSLFGHELFSGSAQLTFLHSGEFLPPAERLVPFQEFLAYLTYTVAHPTWEHINLGPVAPVLIVLGVAGAVVALVKGPARLSVLFAVLVPMLLVAGLMSETLNAQRSYWQAPVVGRFLIPGLGVLAALAGRFTGRIAKWLWISMVMVSFWWARPRGWGEADLEAIVVFLPSILAALAVALFVGWVLVRKGRTQWALLASLVSLVLVAAVPLAAVRGHARGEIYSSAASENQAYDVHVLDWRYASSWPIWNYLDRAEPAVVAVTAGWDGQGHNWYRYPLMGSRLQNRLVYVPPTIDGEIIDYANGEELLEALDGPGWVRRLVEERVDFVVALYPPPVEEEWMAANTQLFELVAEGRFGFGRAYRFRGDLFSQETAEH
jgi:hypothetical protein